MIHSIFSLRSLLYVLYAVLLTAVLLYVRFPAEKFKLYCIGQIESLVPESTCTIKNIGYRFPLSAIFSSLSLSREINGREAAIVAEELVVSLELPQLWRSVAITGKMYSGRFAATLNFDRRAHSFRLANIEGQGIELGALAEGIGISDREMSGIVGFSGDYQAPNRAPGDGTGEGRIEIVNGSFSLLQPILNLSALAFDTISLRVIRDNGPAQLVEGELLGSEIVADFSGDLQVTAPFVTSNIEIIGHLEPDAGYLQAHPQEQQVVQRLLQRYKMTVLPFKVGGTVQRPLFRFST